MTTVKTKQPTVKELRTEAKRLGVTAESAGCPLDELIKRARQTDNPFGYLAVYASVEEERGEKREERGEQTPPSAVPLPPSPLPLPPSVLSTVHIEAPLAEVPIDQVLTRQYHIARHVEARLSQNQGIAMRRLFLALDEVGARLANGKRIVRNADVIRWLLEQIGTRGQGLGARD